MSKGIIIQEPVDIKPTSVRAEGADIIVGAKEKPQDKPDEKQEEKKPVDPPVKKGEPGESVDDRLAKLRESFGYVSKRKKEEAKPKAEDKPAETKKDEPKPDEAKEKPKPKADVNDPEKAERRPSRQEVVEIAEAASAAATRAAMEAKPKRQDPKDDEPDLPEEDKRDYEVFKRMEQDNPKYKGVSKQFVKFTNELAKYQEQWEKDNPGSEFDPDDKAHAAFYERHEPKYDPADFEDSKFNIRIDRAKSQWENENSKKYSEVESKLAEIEVQPKAAAAAQRALQTFVTAVDKDMWKTITDKGPEHLRESDPISYDVVDSIATGVQRAFAEIEKLSHPSGRFRFDSNNDVHVQLDRFAAELDGKFSSMPREDTLRGGKVYISQRDLASVPESSRGRYWTITYDVLREEIIKDAAESAKKTIEAEKERVKRYAEKLGLKPSQTTQKQQGTETQEEPRQQVLKPKSPSASTEPVSAPSTKVADMDLSAPVKNLITSMFQKNV